MQKTLQFALICLKSTNFSQRLSKVSAAHLKTSSNGGACSRWSPGWSCWKFDELANLQDTAKVSECFWLSAESAHASTLPLMDLYLSFRVISVPLHEFMTCRLFRWNKHRKIYDVHLPWCGLLSLCKKKVIFFFGSSVKHQFVIADTKNINICEVADFGPLKDSIWLN